MCFCHACPVSFHVHGTTDCDFSGDIIRLHSLDSTSVCDTLEFIRDIPHTSPTGCLNVDSINDSGNGQQHQQWQYQRWQRWVVVMGGGNSDRPSRDSLTAMVVATVAAMVSEMAAERAAERAAKTVAKTVAKMVAAMVEAMVAAMVEAMATATAAVSAAGWWHRM